MLGFPNKDSATLVQRDLINEIINEEPICKSEMSPYQRPSETIEGI